MSENLDGFREQLGRWLEERADRAPRRTVLEPYSDEDVVARRAWQQELADAGYVGSTWPEHVGGAGGTTAERVVIEQELTRRGIAGFFDFIGIEMIGPTLLVHGTEEQQQRWVLKIRRGDEFWCQLLSEPGAGSDLAAVATKAVQDGDAWVVDGQKVWTSFAQHAAWGILLARTDPDVPKHKGLTMFAVPMDADGLTIRPLRQITGDAEFNEVFMDGVRLTDDLRIGERGQGWRVALTMLNFERVGVGSGLHATPLELLVEAMASADPDRGDLARFGEVATELLALRHTSERVVEGIADGEVPDADAGLIKITSVLASLDACRLAVDVQGEPALQDGRWGHQVSMLPGVRSAGGTEEILRNLIGERVLGLPPEPKPTAVKA